MMDKRGLLLHSQLWKAVFKYLKHYMKILDFLYKATFVKMEIIILY